MQTTLLLADATGFLVVLIVLVALASIFWLWMLIDAITNATLNGTEKIIWVLVVLFGHLIGALIYFFVARGKGSGTAGV